MSAVRMAPNETGDPFDPTPRPDERPGGAIFRETYAEAESAGGRHWDNATDEERERIATLAAVSRRRAEAQARRAGYATVAAFLEATADPPELVSIAARRADLHEVEESERLAAAGWREMPLGPVSAARLAPLATAIDAADLLAMDIPPLRMIVPDLICEGTSVIASPPKIGKSCLVYQAVVETSLGGELLGRRVAPGSALYLALEDGPRRGRDRLLAALAGRTMPRGRLEVRWSAPNIGAGLEDEIARWLDAHADATIVAIDTLGKVRSRGDGKQNAYQVDVDDLGRLQGLFRDRRVALVIVHHSRKETAGDDFLASVSGTYGLTGSADTIVVVKRKRLEAFGSINVTGRDMADAEIPVEFDGLTWHAAPAVVSEGRFERAEVYQVIRDRGPVFPKAIADAIGKERTAVQHLVGEMAKAGAIARTGQGYIVSDPAIVPTLPLHSTHSPREISEGGHYARAGEDNDYPRSAWDSDPEPVA